MLDSGKSDPWLVESEKEGLRYVILIGAKSGKKGWISGMLVCNLAILGKMWKWLHTSLVIVTKKIETKVGSERVGWDID